MKKLKYIIFAAVAASCCQTAVANRDNYEIYVDKHGVMRRSDTKEEVAYYGTNYTLPFAHAYRAMEMVGADRKKIIDLDVSHMKRLGLNGFRLHLWDAELADSAGNLLANDHLDLLDYMIAQLEKEGIDIVLTAQTNFGNGYPEKNIDTGAFTYDFDKCHIHEDPKAQKIQENYLTQLAAHMNPYTGKSYGKDKAIIAMEINNEPCHSGSKKEVTAYINRMGKALRKGGFDRIVLYNVSHNPGVTEAYYDADIQGTTYQWYPVGLVAGHQRKGNFLPVVDNYDIPWKQDMRNYDKLARFVYEFDPGDVLYSHLYPAIARTFRKEGFQWATQFAYDPTPIAAFNTEYQTHYLNLLYTPAKALSMMIAAEVMRQTPRGTDYGSYPENSSFGNFSVSHDPDLSTLNASDKFYYTGSTDIKPSNPDSLRHIAGTGSSPVVAYNGSGAYFLDKTDSPEGNVWRLEVLPDAVITSDPFEKTSLRKPIAALYYASHPIKISLPGIGGDYKALRIDSDNQSAMTARDGSITVTPGVYLLGNNPDLLRKIASEDKQLSRFSAPEYATTFANASKPMAFAGHSPAQGFDPAAPVIVNAEIFSEITPAKVTIYPSTVNFWNETNPLIEMASADGVNYSASIPADMHKGKDFSYNIVIESNDGKKITYPAASQGTPLDWDVTTEAYYTATAAKPDEPMVILSANSPRAELDYAMIPEEYTGWYEIERNAPLSPDLIVLKSKPGNEGILSLRKRVNSLSSPAVNANGKREFVVKSAKEAPQGALLAATDINGASFSAPLIAPEVKDGEYVYTIRIADMKGAPSLVIPAPYPTFLGRVTDVKTEGLSSLAPAEIESVDIRIPTVPGQEIDFPLEYIILR